MARKRPAVPVTKRLAPAPKRKGLASAEVRWKCDPRSLHVATTNDIRPAREIIGQNRAIRALQLGIEISQRGYNVFATGHPGTGRMTTIKRMLSATAKATHKELRDHCYVYNFENEDMPIALSLPAGHGIGLRDDMKNLVSTLVRDIPAVYESNRYQESRNKTIQHFQERQKTILSDFERKVKERGFELVQVQVGNAVRPDIVPVVNGQNITLEQAEAMVKEGAMTREQYDDFRSTQEGLEKQMGAVFRELRNIERKLQDSIRELEDKYVMPVVDDAILIIRTTYDNDLIHKYLTGVREHIRENLDRFRKTMFAQSEPKSPGEAEEDTFIEFSVNVLVDNSRKYNPPVIIELNPKHKNIFGTIERQLESSGIWKTDFMKIKAGSLLRADGGYVVLNALDTLIEPWVWQDLKRTLRNGKLEISQNEPAMGLAVTGMKPQPIDLNVKVIMIGDVQLYQLLAAHDEDFKRIFKVRADFDYEMPRTPDSIKQYTSFMKALCEDEHLLPFDRTALARIIEYGVRLAGNIKKLSTHFSGIADIARESHYWATKETAAVVSGKHVKKAIDERKFRMQMVEDKLHEMFKEGSLLIDTKGEAVGQVNGLAIFDDGEHAFARPVRITAKTSVGREGIINIEREADLSGSIHDKGIGIISGYFKSTYAQRRPLVMDASLTFEQSYSGIDGDSASSTEIYAILSALSGIPIRQDLAVTGSVNQHGVIQPIGGVNEKIEGFYDVCVAKGLTGTQGVLIPIQNKNDLMLREDVVEAVAKKKFHIYEVRTINEGIELLTGIVAGKRLRNDIFPASTVHAAAEATLERYAQEWKKFESGKESAQN